MDDIKMSSVPNLTVHNAINILSKSYCSVINSGLPIKTLPSVMLWGPPGVGKSQLVRQLAKNIETKTKR